METIAERVSLEECHIGPGTHSLPVENSQTSGSAGPIARSPPAVNIDLTIMIKAASWRLGKQTEQAKSHLETTNLRPTGRPARK